MIEKKKQVGIANIISDISRLFGTIIFIRSGTTSIEKLVIQKIGNENVLQNIPYRC